MKVFHVMDRSVVLTNYLSGRFDIILLLHMYGAFCHVIITIYCNNYIHSNVLFVLHV